jgi:TldD protein
VASPHVTVTANRSAPTQLATVKWDDEGVVPPEVTLVKDGVLHDLQTTRDQATRLAPYYQRVGHPVASNGCAAAQDGRHMTLQMRPNFALAPSATSASLEMLLASVKNGFFLEQGEIVSVDAQARNALLRGRLRKIVHGKLVYDMPGAAVQLNTLDFWKNVQAVGDASTTGVYGSSQDLPLLQSVLMPPLGRKGQPAQRTSYSAQGVAAVVTNQAIIDPVRKA